MTTMCETDREMRQRARDTRDAEKAERALVRAAAKADRDKFRQLQQMAKQRGLTLKRRDDCLGVVNWKRGSHATEYMCRTEADVYRAIGFMQQIKRKL